MSLSLSAGTVAEPRTARHRTLLIARRCGRLGNRLVLFGNVLAYAEEHGCHLHDLSFYDYAPYFECLRDDLLYRYPPRNAASGDPWTSWARPILRTKAGYHLVRHASHLVDRVPGFARLARTIAEPPDGSVLDLDSNVFTEACGDAPVIFLRGWLIRAERSVQQHADKIREFFLPVAEHRLPAEERMRQLRQQADAIVGVHIRHGDYRRWLSGKYYFPTSRYADWMRQMKRALGDRRVGFVICSDEPQAESAFPGLQVHSSGLDLIGDLHLLSRCDYVFGAISTFSQWASFYGKVPLLHLRHQQETIHLSKFKVADLGFIPF